MERTRAETDLFSMNIFKGSRDHTRARRGAAAKRSFLPVRLVGLGGLCAVVLMAVTALPSAAKSSHVRSQNSPVHGGRPPESGYMNPLARANVTPERIDMGVDYSGTGTLTAIGTARVIYVGTSNTGWPGAFIEYRLLHGNYAGRYVYYAEGVRPARGIHVGKRVRPGMAVAHLIRGWSTGIEVGWAAGIGTETLAEKYHQYNFPTRCGMNFSSLIASLGGPPGQGQGASSKEAGKLFGKP